MIQDVISFIFAFFLSLFSVLSNNPALTQGGQLTNNQVTILFTGDIMLGRSVMGEAIDRNDYLYPFRNVQGFLSDADITFVNLENAIIEKCPRQYTGSFTFCTTPEIAKGLQESGIDIVSLANNHSGNFGKTGLDETKQILDNLGIKWVDGTNLETIEKGGVKFGFLGFDYVYKGLTDADLLLIEESDKLVDVLIIMPHWGEEYKSTANNFQTHTAKKFIEKGADVIVGNHPHWAQNYEVIDGKHTYYSLGNFIFDQMWNEETKKGMAVKMFFEEGNVVDRQEYKIYIEKLGQPVLK